MGGGDLFYRSGYQRLSICWRDGRQRTGCAGCGQILTCRVYNACGLAGDIRL